MAIPLRALILEDNPSDAALILHELRRAGYDPSAVRVETEPDYRDALQPPPEVILADFTLPAFDALRALEIMHECRLKIPFIVVSGSIGEERAVEALHRGATDYVGKDRLGSLGQAVARGIERSASDVALRQSELRYRTLVAATSAIVWHTPPTGEFVAEQPVWTGFTGQTFDQLRGRGWLNAVHPDDRESTSRAWAASLAGRKAFFEEHRMRRADGEYRQMAVRAVPILGPDRAIREWVGVHTDVTDRRRAEVERAEILGRLTLQFERMPLAYLLTGPDFRYTDWNPAAERTFGFSKAEVLGKHPFDVIVPPRSRPLVADNFARLAAGDMDAHVTCANVTKDGRSVTCEWHNTPLFGPDDAFHGVLSVAQDVTERARAEGELRLFRALIDRTTDGIEVIDPASGRFLDVNETACSAHGYSRDEYLRLRVADIDPLVAAESWAARIARGRLDGVQTFESRHLRKDGTTFPVEVNFNTICVDRDYMVAVVRDVTDRKQLEEQFRQAQKMEAVGQLAAGVAHDFNNLLTIINGYSDLLLQGLGPDDPFRDMVAEIAKAGERSAGLTRQLLMFSRQQVLDPRLLDLNEVVAATEMMLGRLIGEDLRVTATLDPELWTVRADQGQVEQVLMNLAVNARDAMPKGGQLTIETQNVELDEAYVRSHPDARAGRHVLLSVSDTGGGMPPEVRAKVFEPFFTTKPVGKGTGLGLATVYGIVRQCGGHVAVYSEVGVGTTFKVYLPPAVATAPPAKSLPDPPAAPQGSETVLLVEDETGLRVLVRHVLGLRGYTVLEAADGEAAVRLAAGYDGPIHMLLTDVVMPGAGGREVAEQLAGRYPGLRVLFMSGYTDDAVIRHGVLREGVNFIQKPFSPLALTFKVRNVLDAPVVTATV